MQTVNIELYRLRIFEGLYPLAVARSTLIQNALYEPVSIENHGFTWTFGNRSVIDGDAILFRVGRRGGVNLSEYDRGMSRFRDFVTENWPSTYVFCDIRLSVVAIVKNHNLAGDSETVAHRIEDILKRTSAMVDAFVSVSVKPIGSASDFMSELRSAFLIKKFAFEFKPPNPFDAEEIIQKPLERYLREANGSSGEVEITGNNLRAAVVEDTARSSISSGNEVKATIKRNRQSRAEPISSRSYPETIRGVAFDPDDSASIASVLELVRRKYEEGRFGEREEDG
ncbi:hypothetical protein [Deinococcus sp.]|uniref:hypothetical protein n=1 Tax=Deinococcus sp. TaxID=47478 RepID=UPI003B58BBD0